MQFYNWIGQADDAFKEEFGNFAMTGRVFCKPNL